MILFFICNVAAKLLYAGEQTPGDKSVTITFSQQYLSYRYCVRDDEFKGRSQNEFNNPNVKKFMDLTPVKFLSSPVYHKLLNVGSLQYGKNSRCKEVFLYGYDPLLQREVPYIQHQVDKLFQGQLAHPIEECQEFIFRIQILGDKKGYSLDLSNCELRDEFNYMRRIQGEGLHQHLISEIRLNVDIQQDEELIILDNIDIYTYVDKDELDKLKEEYIQQTVIDIEKPAEHSAQHILISKHKAQQVINYEHLYHFRYQMPALEPYLDVFVPIQPQVYIIKTDTKDLFDAINNGQAKKLTSRQKDQYQTYQVPVGFSDHKETVLFVTISTTLCSAIYLIWLMYNKS